MPEALPPPQLHTRSIDERSMFNEIGEQVQALRSLSDTDPNRSPYLHLRPEYIAAEEREKANSPLNEQLRNLRIYIGSSIGKEVERVREAKGLTPDERLSLEEFDAIRDKYRKFYVNMFLDEQPTLHPRDKDTVREMFGIKEARDSRRAREGKADSRTDGADPIQREPKQWVKDNILAARALGVFEDSDAPVLVQDLRRNDQELLDDAGIPKKGLSDKQKAEKKELLKQSRFTVAKEYLEAKGVYDDTDNQEIIWTLAQALAAARELDDLGIDPSEIS